MKKTDVQVKLTNTLKGKTENSYTITVSNPSKQLAFFLNPQVMSGDEEIMPCFWSDNYFSLAPGEFRSISVRVPVKLIKSGPEIFISGWNVVGQKIKL
jgi:hypothetical protein